jgi:hypothetical protein
LSTEFYKNVVSGSQPRAQGLASSSVIYQFSLRALRGLFYYYYLLNGCLKDALHWSLGFITLICREVQGYLQNIALSV